MRTNSKKERPVAEPARQETPYSNVVAEADERDATPSFESDDVEMPDWGLPVSPEPTLGDAPGPSPEPRNVSRRRSRRRRPRMSTEPTWIGSPVPTPCENPWPYPEPVTNDGLRPEPVTVMVSTVFLGLGGGALRLWMSTVEAIENATKELVMTVVTPTGAASTMITVFSLYTLAASNSLL